MVKKLFPSFFAIIAGIVQLTGNLIGILVLHLLTFETYYLLVANTFLIESIVAGIGGFIILYEGIKAYRTQVAFIEKWIKRGTILMGAGLAISLIELVTYGPNLPAQIGYPTAIMLTALRGVSVQLSLIALRESEAREKEAKPV